MFSSQVLTFPQRSFGQSWNEKRNYTACYPSLHFYTSEIESWNNFMRGACEHSRQANHPANQHDWPWARASVHKEGSAAKTLSRSKLFLWYFEYVICLCFTWLACIVTRCRGRTAGTSRRRRQWHQFLVTRSVPLISRKNVHDEAVKVVNWIISWLSLALPFYILCRVEQWKCRNAGNISVAPACDCWSCQLN